MNIIRIRDTVKQMLAGNLYTKIGADRFLTAPVFQYEQATKLTDSETEWCKQNILGPDGIVPIAVPFENFIIAKSGGNTLYVKSRPYFTTNPDDGKQVKILMTITSRFMETPTEEWWFRFQYTGRIEKGIICAMWYKGKETPTPKKADALEELSIAGANARQYVIALCFDCMSPSSVMLRVKPQATGKSVQWVESRTHYCIIHKKQAEVLRHNKSGPSDKTLIRSAHSRRAHLRRLTSDRFTNKKGLLVFVKQTWVGPKEWIGTDKKIYTVITNSP